jgi:plastocyanin
MRGITEVARRRLAVALVTIFAGIALAAGGCGDDDDEGTVEEAGVTETGGAGVNPSRLAVSETEYKLDPADPTVNAGPVTIEVSNDGEAVHNLEVEGPSGEAELEDDLEPGEVATLEVDLSETGTYEWYCPVANHADLGMEGEIRVK